MRTLHDNQKKILDYLLSHADGATLEDLVQHLGITKTAVKEHLIKIDSYGYISHIDTRSGVGRPKRKYLLSQEGHEAFPRQYSWLSHHLLEYLAQKFGREASSEMMTDLAEEVYASLAGRFQNQKTSSEMLSELTKVLNELGYKAYLRQGDLRKGAVIEAINCVYHSVAKQHPSLCRFDIKFMEVATGGLDVKLESCIARGASVCRFCLRKSSSEGTKS